MAVTINGTTGITGNVTGNLTGNVTGDLVGIDDNATSTAITIDSSQIVSGIWSDNGTANANSKLVKLTQAQYDAITPDDNTIYFIV